MKKKTLNTILISAAIAVVVIAAIVFSILLRPDAHGLNAFERSKVIATASGQSVTMGEYAMGLSSTLSYYSYYGITYTPDQATQDSVIEDLLLQKLYIAKLDELGLSLTAEELAACKMTAKDQLASLEESIGKQLSTSSNFSTASVQSQINDYFSRQLGMTKAQYVAYVEQEEKAELAAEKVKAYYEAQTKNYSEEELLAYYNEYVTESYGDDYTEGNYSTYMSMYTLGYYTVPWLYVPEGFIYVDIVQIDAETEDEINELYATLESGATFADLVGDSRNTATMHLSGIEGPYAIGEGDASYVAGYADLYAVASEMEIGETKLVIEPETKTDDDGNETTTYAGYIILRTEGNLCENGAQYGVVDIDCYEGVRDQVASGFESTRFNEITTLWLADKWVDASAYAYTGA